MQVEARFNEDYEEIASTYVFIQWKGTEVCLDFHCDCGTGGHFDGDFAYALRCAGCGKSWSMPHSIELVEGFGNGSVKDVPKEYGDERDGALCWACNKPATYDSEDLVMKSFPKPGSGTTSAHVSCEIKQAKPFVSERFEEL